MTTDYVFVFIENNLGHHPHSRYTYRHQFNRGYKSCLVSIELNPDELYFRDLRPTREPARGSVSNCNGLIYQA